MDEHEAYRFNNAMTAYASEEDERRSKKYDKYYSCAKGLPKLVLCEAYEELIVELDEIRFSEK